jgi:hypothetical protein
MMSARGTPSVTFFLENDGQISIFSGKRGARLDTSGLIDIISIIGY